MASHDDPPKSAYELAMERLRKRDADEGASPVPLTDEQKQAIAEVKRVYEARLAEGEILHRSSLARARDEEAAAAIDEEYRRDRERIQGERERKLEEVRGQR